MPLHEQREPIPTDVIVEIMSHDVLPSDLIRYRYVSRQFQMVSYQKRVWWAAFWRSNPLPEIDLKNTSRKRLERILVTMERMNNIWDNPNQYQPLISNMPYLPAENSDTLEVPTCWFIGPFTIVIRGGRQVKFYMEDQVNGHPVWIYCPLDSIRNGPIYGYGSNITGYSDVGTNTFNVVHIDVEEGSVFLKIVSIKIDTGATAFTATVKRYPLYTVADFESRYFGRKFYLEVQNDFVHVHRYNPSDDESSISSVSASSDDTETRDEATEIIHIATKFRITGSYRAYWTTNRYHILSHDPTDHTVSFYENPVPQNTSPGESPSTSSINASQLRLTHKGVINLSSGHKFLPQSPSSYALVTVTLEGNTNQRSIIIELTMYDLEPRTRNVKVACCRRFTSEPGMEILGMTKLSSDLRYSISSKTYHGAITTKLSGENMKGLFYKIDFNSEEPTLTVTEFTFRVFDNASRVERVKIQLFDLFNGRMLIQYSTVPYRDTAEDSEWADWPWYETLGDGFLSARFI